MGPHCGLILEKIVCRDVTLKAVVFKTPGQTNSGALCLLQDFLRGRFVAASRGPMVAYFDKMSCNRCNEAPLCGFLPSVDSCPAQFADEFRRWAFNASPAFQLARWLFRSIGLGSRTPSYSLLSARADAFRTLCAIQCRLSILRSVLVVFFLVAFVLGRNKKPSSR